MGGRKKVVLLLNAQGTAVAKSLLVGFLGVQPYTSIAKGKASHSAFLYKVYPVVFLFVVFIAH